MSNRFATRRRAIPFAASVPGEHGPIQLPAYARELWKNHRYKVLWGGRGATRSWTVARTLLLKAAKSRLRILCAREMQSSLRDSVHQLLKDQIDLMGLDGFLVTDREIRHANGTLFVFEGLRHNATKIKSMEGIDIVWVEEAERISKESWSILIPTIRKPGSEIWVTFNPDQEDDATYVRFILKPGKDVWQKKVNSDDNPWLSPELREEREYAYATDPESADHVWGGNIRKISEAQIMRGKWSVEEFTVPYRFNAKTKQNEPLWDGPYQGIDFGFGSDPAAAVRLWIHADILYVEYEAWKLHLEIDDMGTYFETEIPHFADFTSRADSSRPDSISYLRRHTIPNIRAAKKHAGSVADGIAHLRSYRKIILHPRCIHVRDECKNYSYKVDVRSGDVLPIIVDKHNHLIDCARYALDPLIRSRLRPGFIFMGREKIATCPQCSSLLPDSGECPHCGFDEAKFVDHEALDSDVPATTVAVGAEPPTNGNGHRNGHSNGHASVANRVRPLRMRDLNR